MVRSAIAALIRCLPAGLALCALGPLWTGCSAGSISSANPAPGLPPPSSSPSADDPRVEWLRDHAVALRTIDPADDDVSDLEPLRSALAGARVVILGEATHADGSAFLAKSRIVRFLHREMGFDVLAFESGFYDCWKARRRIEAGHDPEEALRRSVFPVWTRAAQFQAVIDQFVAAAGSDRPLRLAGFDPQFTGELSERFLLADLKRVAEAVGLSGEDFGARISSTLDNVVHARYQMGELPAAAAREDFLDALAELEERLRAETGRDVAERAFWVRLLESTRDYADNSWKQDFTRSLLEDPENYPVRDRLMGEQLAWLARERFPEGKIVAWMHSGHAARGLAGVEVPSPVHTRLWRTLRPAGAVAHHLLGDAVYTVGVTAYQGDYLGRGELLQPSPGSLEDLLHRAGFDHAFVDLSHPGRLPRWLQEPLIARPLGYMEGRTRWSEVFDGILYLDRMEARRAMEEKPSRNEGPLDGADIMHSLWSQDVAAHETPRPHSRRDRPAGARRPPNQRHRHGGGAGAGPLGRPRPFGQLRGRSRVRGLEALRALSPGDVPLLSGGGDVPILLPAGHGRGAGSLGRGFRGRALRP